MVCEDEVAQMYSSIQTGRAKGMQTLDQYLGELVSKNTISRDSARELALSKCLF